MRLTSYTDFSLRTLIYLGLRSDKLVKIQEISDAYDISKHHLTKVVYALGRAGFITTIRGKGGGIKLARPAELIKVADIIVKMEPDLRMAECFEESSKCRIQDVCKLNGVLRNALGAFVTVLEGYSLADILPPDNLAHELLGIPVTTE